MTDRPLTGATLLLDGLVEQGVRLVFGVPGDTGIGLYDAFATHPAAPRHVLARDERNAAYMADGYARVTGRPGVCEASSGAGAVYLASGLGEAFAASVPVLAITSDIARASRSTGAVTEIDQEALFTGVTVWRATAQRAREIPRLLSRAVHEAANGRPGPAALIVPEDVLDEEVTDRPVTPAVPRERPRADGDSVARVARRLGAARCPVLLVGGGLHAAAAWGPLEELVNRFGIPVATTIQGKGALAEDHPLALGVAGGNGCRGYANRWLARSDAVVVVGARGNATDTNGYTSPPRAGAVVAGVDVDAARAGRNFETAEALVGDAGAVLEQLADALPAPDPATVDTRIDELARDRREWMETAHTPNPDLPAGVLDPRDVVEVLHRGFGPEAVVVGDPGTPTPYLSAYWEAAGGARRVVIPRGHGPMGYALPSAIGAALAGPERRVVCLTTESSVAMAAGDWETAARLRVPVTFVVLDNVSMAWIKMLQHLFTERRYFGVEPGPIDPVLIARGHGVPGRSVSDVAELERAVGSAAGEDGPTVIHVRVPEHPAGAPPVAAWQAALTSGSRHRPVY